VPSHAREFWPHRRSICSLLIDEAWLGGLLLSFNLWRRAPCFNGCASSLCSVDRVIEKLATSDKVTLVAERQPEGKMRVTSASWADEKVLAPDEVLEVRCVSGRLQVARKERHHGHSCLVTCHRTRHKLGEDIGVLNELAEVFLVDAGPVGVIGLNRTVPFVRVTAD
jgi:hypothetical protein